MYFHLHWSFLIHKANKNHEIFKENKLKNIDSNELISTKKLGRYK